MKKQYDRPDMEIEKFTDEDVLTTSGAEVKDDYGSDIYVRNFE